MFRLISGIFLGWALGSNDAANIFGTAVASRMIKFWTAAVLTSVFVILGAVLEGTGGMETLGSLSTQTMSSAFITSLAAALTVTLMTVLKLPVSTSQAAVGAIIGTGLIRNTIDFSPLGRIVLAWILTPVGAMVISVLLYLVLGWLVERYVNDILTLDRIIKAGLILAGIYGAYALGANNIANVTGVFVESGAITALQGAVLGGLGIASGVLTYSKNVMLTVGKGITDLSPFNSLVAVLAEATTVYIYARIGIPVSTSQAIVGAVAGLGLIKGMNFVNRKVVIKILFGWLGTPSIACLISLVLAWFWL